MPTPSSDPGDRRGEYARAIRRTVQRACARRRERKRQPAHFASTPTLCAATRLRFSQSIGIVGAKATELIQELVNAKLLEGGYPEVARIIHGHPTLSEAVMEAARAADGWLIHG
jgi:hypothetical protein